MQTDDEFHIHARLGSGSTGVVFRGTRKRDGHQIALKALHPDFVTAMDIHHLRACVQALDALDHHAIPPELELMELRGEMVLARPFLRAIDLGSIIAGSSAPLGPALQIASEVAGALATVKRKTGFAHGDLKPSNVFLDSTGDLHVVDFGMARALPGMSERTLTLLHGSVGFMSPERADNQASDHSDTYSLGLLICWMLTGETPPRTSANPKRQGEQRAQLVGAVKKVANTDSLVELVDACLQYEPEQRPDLQEAARLLAVLSAKVSGPALKTWGAPIVHAIVAQSTEVAIIDDGKPLSTAGPAPMRTVSTVPAAPEVDAPGGLSPTLMWGLAAVVVALAMLAGAFSLGAGS